MFAKCSVALGLALSVPRGKWRGAVCTHRVHFGFVLYGGLGQWLGWGPVWLYACNGHEEALPRRSLGPTIS